ncbi:HWE histidine kinase domain-containing protein [Kozakia baliensis]|uniref:HWE histidine kinase domain-containing protein n=1 Tax=Kozakia baliensis TaxID=153496 RepID=UPI000ACCEA8F|nr:HWE histidine kinase domain-containing protein [Kozakia baliensis]
MVDFGQANLTSCDREPIHIPGSIQPHGCLLACSAKEFLLLRLSANAASMLDLPELRPEAPLAQFLGPELTHELRNASTASLTRRHPTFLFGIRLPSGKFFDIAVHVSGDEVVLEFEPAEAPGATDRLIAQLHMMIERARNITDLQKLFDTVARLLRGVLHYDRVMVYRFDHDWSGKIVAEARAPALESFLGQHFPAGDIPAQARELYRRSPIRMIGDVSYTPVPLLGLPGLLPLDMSLAQLRSVSPIHCEYLTNMGVGASMSISLIVDDELWGMVACHNYSPRTLTLSERAVVHMFGEFIALQIVVLLRTTRLQVAERTHALLENVLRDAATMSDMPSYLRDRIADLMPLIQCDGVAIWIGNEWTAHGITPPSSAAPEIVALAQQLAGTQIWHSSHLADQFDWAKPSVSTVAGMMVIPVSPQPGNYVFLFRREIIQTINWGGDPKKTYTTGPHGARLTPRQSFQIWKEQVHERCLSWSSNDVEAAAMLRSTMIEVMGVYHQQQLTERAEADVRQRMLNEELNHRVKNILAVVQSLISRPVPKGRALEEYVNVLRGRINALASAHDQVARTDGGGMLRTLLEAELEPYRHQPSVIHIEGADIWLTGRALSVAALVFHELATNAVKYGCLSTQNGHLTIKWHFDAETKSWVVIWQETGGPPVKAPSGNGFGSVLLERAFPHELGGTAKREFRPDGLFIRLTIPEHYAALIPQENIPQTDPVEVEEKKNGSEEILRRANILLVEDQLLVAMETEQALQEHGAERVRTVASVYEALQAVRASRPDIALLDFNLGGETSEEVARTLRERGIPFVFATGYADKTMIPSEFRDIPVLRKPYSMSSVIRELESNIFPSN